jgi:TM2 domain-containing membrane protein YozV
MHKASLLAGLILSFIVPGSGLLLVKKGGWFAIYLFFSIIGFFLLFFWGLGSLIIIPTGIISFVHTFFAIRAYNRLAI